MDQKFPFISSSSLTFHHCICTLIVILLSSLLLLNVLPPLQSLSLLNVPFVSSPSSSSRSDDCDYSNGRWVWDDNRNAESYSEECKFLDPGFRCVENGRNHTGYRNWRWQPHGCDLPRFNASELLERSRNKRIVFVGDSLGRNQWESLLCMLSTAVKNESSMYEVNGKPISKHSGFLCIQFDEFNITIEYYRSPFLVAVDRLPPDAPPGIRKTIRIDTPNWQSKHWADADVLIFNTGHWWTDSKKEQMKFAFQMGNNLDTTIDLKTAFQRSIDTVTEWSLSNMQLDRSFLFFRSFTSPHYSNGTWKTGGSCDEWTDPETDLGKPRPEYWHNRVIYDSVEKMKKQKGTRHAYFLNVTYLTDLRRDGHPGSNRVPRKDHVHDPQDCSHWCLPGVPDAWNDLLYAYLVSYGYGIKRQQGTS